MIDKTNIEALVAERIDSARREQGVHDARTAYRVFVGNELLWDVAAQARPSVPYAYACAYIDTMLALAQSSEE